MHIADLYIPYPAYELKSSDVLDDTDLYNEVLKQADHQLTAEDLPREDRLPLVVYHANCLDGMTAAYQAWRGLKGHCILVEWDYSLPPLPVSLVADRIVYTVDFSFTVPMLSKMLEARKFIMLDHHRDQCISIFNDLAGKPELASWARLIYNKEHSGAWLAWDYFIRERATLAEEEHTPLMVSYVEDRDLWRFEMLNTKQFCEALSLYPKNIRSWYSADSISVHQMIETGVLLLRAKAEELKQLASRAAVYQKGSLTYILVNADPAYASDLGQHLYEECPKVDFVAIYSTDEATRTTKYSLRSSPINGADVAEIARIYGGNGHKHAAGFTVPYDQGVFR